MRSGTHHELDSGIGVVDHEIVVGFVTHPVDVPIDVVTSEADGGSDVVLDGVVAEDVSVAASVKACRGRRTMYGGEGRRGEGEMYSIPCMAVVV